MTIPRTIWDLASTLSSQQTRRAFEQAAGHDRLDRQRLAELLETSPSRKGSGVTRTLLADRIVPLAEVRSWLEELLLTICVDRSLPFPAVNVPLLGYQVDFLWERERFVAKPTAAITWSGISETGTTRLHAWTRRLPRSPRLLP